MLFRYCLGFQDQELNLEEAIFSGLKGNGKPHYHWRRCAFLLSTFRCPATDLVGFKWILWEVLGKLISLLDPGHRSLKSMVRE